MKKSKAEVIVTRDSLKRLLLSENKDLVMHTVGVALVRLFESQTTTEQAANTTNVDNGVGFAGMDAKSGSISAKTYLKHKSLPEWVVDRWLKVGKTGYPRLCKYHAQLNAAALKKKRLKSI